MMVLVSKDTLNLTGKHVDKYQFRHLLECGENVSVYLGYDRHAEREVAIKVVHNVHGAEARPELFIEKALLAVLVHPHIVRMLDFVECPSFALLVTEYVARGSLRDCLNARTKLPMATRVKYISQAANALQYMHNRKYIHRDVKPENMLLTPDDNILLCDLGIAIPIPGSNEQTNSMGTALYAPLEQINGYPSPKSDQYALAGVACELLCGTPPFSGTESHLVLKQIFEAPTLPHSRSKKLPLAAELVIRRALAKEPEERFPCIEAFAQELEDALYSPSSILSAVTDEVECVRKAPETTDCKQQYKRTTYKQLKRLDTN